MMRMRAREEGEGERFLLVSGPYTAHNAYTINTQYVQYLSTSVTRHLSIALSTVPPLPLPLPPRQEVNPI